MTYHISIGTANLGQYSIIGTILTIAAIVATVMLFRKAGKEGWEAIIPFYNSYTEYQLFWTTRMFWVSFVLKVFTVLCLLTILIPVHPVFLVTAAIGVAGLIAWLVIDIKMTQKIAHAFNRRGAFTVGLFFIGTIFRMILAFGKDEYAGANL